MRKYKTFIKQKEITSYFIERSKKEKRKYSKKDIVSFIKFCEIDFFEWLNSNYNYFVVGKEDN